MYEGLVACICEGGAERTIVEILLDNNLLKFSSAQLLDGEILGRRDRSAKNFEKNHLRKEFDEKITIVRILDSINEKFELSKLYANKVEIVNVVTAPEIEMLIKLCPGKVIGITGSDGNMYDILKISPNTISNKKDVIICVSFRRTPSI